MSMILSPDRGSMILEAFDYVRIAFSGVQKAFPESASVSFFLSGQETLIGTNLQVQRR
jgi:hypothetical protein